MELAPENPPSLTCSPRNEFVRSHPSHPWWLTRKESWWALCSVLALPRMREAGDDSEPETPLWGLLGRAGHGRGLPAARVGQSF